MKSEIYLAGGCFWGVEKYLGLLGGVIETEVGYANGHTQSPTYEDVCKGDTGFTEAVRVVYDTDVISFDNLLSHFYNIIDPTTKNRQGADIGDQYRSGIYYTNANETDAIATSLANLQKSYEKPIAVENLPLKNYYKAEEYHQKYLEKNPGGYCHIPEHKHEEARKG
ncbi:MAG: peptide-methionine (S)-S-oxide reductase MsrA [Defluviitaleaceae bacterium]|nr:peptide-methionine (S)-S-oxide reductase MsrA [Defluviitaleaceae bacterium]